LSEGTIIKGASVEDSSAIARLHKVGIDQGFLSKQSDDFLSALYRHLIKNEIVFVAKKDDHVVGFVAGTLTTSGLFKKFLLNNIPLLIKFAISNIFSVSFIKKCFETLFSPMKIDSDAGKGLPELLSIVVDSQFAGIGTGQKLVEALDAEFLKRGINKYKVIVGSSLKANKFYLKNGFEKIGEVEIHRGYISYVYVKSLSDLNE
jgi:ribosomal protein S18 acetylase RimI-like enzyme